MPGGTCGVIHVDNRLTYGPTGRGDGLEIGSPPRQLREGKHFSQSDLERRSALGRSYISRVESGGCYSHFGHPEKMGVRSEIALWELFDAAPASPRIPGSRRGGAWIAKPENWSERFRGSLAKIAGSCSNWPATCLKELAARARQRVILCVPGVAGRPLPARTIPVTSPLTTFL